MFVGVHVVRLGIASVNARTSSGTARCPQPESLRQRGASPTRRRREQRHGVSPTSDQRQYTRRYPYPPLHSNDRHPLHPSRTRAAPRYERDQYGSVNHLWPVRVGFFPCIRCGWRVLTAPSDRNHQRRAGSRPPPRTEPGPAAARTPDPGTRYCTTQCPVRISILVSSLLRDCYRASYAGAPPRDCDLSLW
jgi:hypothetical protein